MTIWLILAGIALATMILLVVPLWRSPRHAQTRADFDAQIYRDQLVEIERDAESSRIPPEQAATARTEIARRLLAVTDNDTTAGDTSSPHTTAEGTRDAARAARRGISVFIGLTVPLAAFGVYMIVGSPHLPSQPGLEAQARAPAPKPRAPGLDASQLLAQLAEKLKERPNDLKGWTLYASNLARLGRFGDAAAA